jgi:hypothetical protein
MIPTMPPATRQDIARDLNAAAERLLQSAPRPQSPWAAGHSSAPSNTTRSWQHSTKAVTSPWFALNLPPSRRG